MYELNPVVEKGFRMKFSKLDVQAPDFEKKSQDMIDQFLEMSYQVVVNEGKNKVQSKEEKSNQAETFNQITDEILEEVEKIILESSVNENVTSEEKEKIIQKVKEKYTNGKISTILRKVDIEASTNYDTYINTQDERDEDVGLLTEEMKNNLKAKFQTLDIQDEHFQEKLEEIINEALRADKSQASEHIIEKRVDRALKEEKAGFAELKDLMNDGIFDDIEDIELKKSLQNQANNGILDENEEKISLKEVISAEMETREALIGNIIEEILKQLEDVIEEKKQEIQLKIEKNEDMYKKVERRDKLRASKARVNQLHQKTKNYKGKEGKELNQNIEATIIDFDRQIEALTLATTVNGKEKQAEELEQEKQQLLSEKQKLDDMLKLVKEKYTKERYKEASKIILKDELQKKMNSIQYGMDSDKLIENAEDIRKIFLENREKFTIGELRTIFKSVYIIDKKGSRPKITASMLADIGAINDIRKLYIYETGQNKENNAEEIKWYQDQFDGLSENVRKITGRKVRPLKTEKEYVEELEELGGKTSDKKDSTFEKRLKDDAVKTEILRLRSVLKQVIGFVNTNGIQTAYNKVIKKLKDNASIPKEELPEDFIEEEPLKKLPDLPKQTNEKSVSQEGPEL